MPSLTAGFAIRSLGRFPASTGEATNFISQIVASVRLIIVIPYKNTSTNFHKYDIADSLSRI